MNKTETFNVSIDEANSFDKTIRQQNYCATIEKQNVDCRTDLERKEHAARVAAVYLLDGDQDCYKGDFLYISDLANIKAYNNDYADVYETQTRWVYQNGSWVDTKSPILVNPRIVTSDMLSSDVVPNTVVKRNNNGSFSTSEPTENKHVVNKEYLQKEIAKAINLANKTYVKEFTKSDFKTVGLYSLYCISIPKSEHNLENPYVVKILAKCKGDNISGDTFLEPIVTKEKVFVDGSIKIYIEVNLLLYSEYSGKIYLKGE